MSLPDGIIGEMYFEKLNRGYSDGNVERAYNRLIADNYRTQERWCEWVRGRYDTKEKLFDRLATEINERALFMSGHIFCREYEHYLTGAPMEDCVLLFYPDRWM